MVSINHVRNNRNATQTLTVYLMSKYLEGKYLPYLCCLGLSLCRKGVDHTATLIYAPKCLHCWEAVPGLEGKRGVKKEGKGIKAAVHPCSFQLSLLAKLQIGRHLFKHEKRHAPDLWLCCLASLYDAFGVEQISWIIPSNVIFKKESHSFCRGGNSEIRLKHKTNTDLRKQLTISVMLLKIERERREKIKTQKYGTN